MIINSVMVTGDVIELIDTSPGHTYYLRWPKNSMPARNAMIASWGLAQKARIWFNTDTKQLEMWDGTKVVLVG